jgi:hypothetical protein
MPVLLTRDLDETIRHAEKAGIACGIQTMQRLWPDVGATSIEVAGGLVVFTGVESPLSQAYGVGLDGPVSYDDIVAITEFYESCGATPRVFVSPLSDPTLARGLASTGYAPLEYENVLAADDLASKGHRDDRVSVAQDLAAWARASASAFMDGKPLVSGDDFVGLVLASSEGVCALEIRNQGGIAATAAMDVRGDCSALFAASTLPTFRGRGWHLALIADRLVRAHEAGASFARATAKPGSASERNFHRCGFVTLYTRALWERKLRRSEVV